MYKFYFLNIVFNHTLLSTYLKVSASNNFMITRESFFTINWIIFSLAYIPLNYITNLLVENKNKIKFVYLERISSDNVFPYNSDLL